MTKLADDNERNDHPPEEIAERRGTGGLRRAFPLRQEAHQALGYTRESRQRG